MKLRSLIWISSAIISSLSCKQKDLGSVAYYNVPDLTKKAQVRKIASFNLDTLALAPNIETSYIGSFWVSNNALYYTDTQFMYVYQFDLKHNTATKFIGQGGGPNEVSSQIGDVVFNAATNSYNVFMPQTGVVYSFNTNWEKQSKFVIDHNITRGYSDILENPNPRLADSYEVANQYDAILKPWDSSYVAIAIEAAHPKFNGYYNSELYYNYSRILGLVNLQTGKIEQLIGRRSPYYLKNKSLPIFDHFNYDTFGNTVFVDFMIGKDIYVLDKQTGLAVGKFGEAAKDMNTNYKTTHSYEEGDDLHYQHRITYGYYTSLKYLPEQDMLFRSYYKGKHTDFDGLQIYKDYTLLGDLNVPKGFKIIGFIDDAYIGTIQNEDQNDFEIFKIKFNYDDN